MLGTQKVDVSFCPPGKTLEIQDCNNTDNCKTTRNADIAFVFDESESMRDSANFEVQTQFASDISKIFTKDPDAIVDFAFIDFSTTAAIELTFAQFSDFKKNDPQYNMPNWLQNVNKQRPALQGEGYTGIVRALEKTIKMFEDHDRIVKNRQHLDKDRHVIMLTDGRENVANANWQFPDLTRAQQLQIDAATKLKKMNVTIWVVGFGDDRVIDPVALQGISGHGEHVHANRQYSTYYTISAFDNAKELAAITARLRTDITSVTCRLPKNGTVVNETWSACSETCGAGVETLQYTCTQPDAGGCPCVHPTIKTRQCNLGCCKVEPQIGQWTVWSTCSKTCATGSQSRSRTCNPDPFCPGTPCPNNLQENRNCNQNICCPVNSLPGQWSTWGSCSAKCDGGVQMRTRSCTPAICGGSACPQLSEPRTCNTHSCKKGEINTHKNYERLQRACQPHFGQKHTIVYDKRDHPITMFPDLLLLELNAPNYTWPTHTVVSNYNTNNFTFMALGNQIFGASHFVVRDVFKNMNSNRFQFGRHKAKPFEARTMCETIKFTQTMTDIPAVKVSVHVPCWDHFMNVWTKNVNKEGFEICRREGISFSGEHRDVTFHWAAVGGDNTLVFETHTHAEGQRIKMSTTDAIPKENIWFKEVTYNHNFKEPPRVFVTSEQSATNGDGADYTAWVQTVKRRTAIVCARSSDDYSNGTRMRDIHLNIVVIGHRVEIDAGIIEMKPVAGHPHVGCNEVKLSGGMFSKNESDQFHTQLTVNWKDAAGRVWSKVHPASAVWSENVTIDENGNGRFRVCVMVAGAKLPYMPKVNWIAHQVFYHHAHQPNYILAGSVTLDPWYAGSRCKEVKPDWHPLRNDTSVIVSVEHTKNKYTDAMTAWSEINENGTLRLCARELRNFDGLHEGVKLHYLINYEVMKPYVAEKASVDYLRQRFHLSSAMPTVCKTIEFKLNYSSVEKMSVIVTAQKDNWPNCPECGTEFSSNDFSTWIEDMSKTHVNVCMKSLRCGMYRESAEAHLIVAPILCGTGWQYIGGSCFKKSDDMMVRQLSFQTCQAEKAHLPIATTRSQTSILDKLSGKHDTWLGMTGEGRTASDLVWKWDSPSGKEVTYPQRDGTYTKTWMPKGKPDGKDDIATNLADEKCAVTIGGTQRGWDDMNCLRSNHYICQKQAPDIDDDFLNN